MSLTLKGLTGLVLLLGVTADGAVAQTPASVWELTALQQPVRHLVAGSAGALFATTDTQLFRSDDSGDTWRVVALPADNAVAAVDPSNQQILYAAAGQLLYRTDDGGTTWHAAGQYTPDDSLQVSRLVVSPADPSLLYVALAQLPGRAAEGRLLRSRDRGATWQQLQAVQQSLCAWSVLLLQPHPTDPGRVFSAAACLAGRTFGATLQQSSDAGTTWTAIFNPQPYATPELGYPTELVGGQNRFYLAANRDARLGGSGVFRSDDDGVSWTSVLTLRGGGTSGFRAPEDDPNAPNIRIGGLAADANDADRVYAGQLIYDRYPPSEPVAGGVLVSRDAGATWDTLGCQDLGGVNALALGIDGRYLFAATAQGVSRLIIAVAGEAAADCEVTPPSAGIAAPDSTEPVPAAGVEPASSLYESAALTVELGGLTGARAKVYREDRPGLREDG